MVPNNDNFISWPNFSFVYIFDGLRVWDRSPNRSWLGSIGPD